MLTIREMKPSDLQRVAEIEKQIFSMPWSKKGFADSIKQDCTLFLTVEEDGEIVGYCGLLQSFDEAEITNVAVEEKSRGQGIAKRMLKELLRRGSERGIRVYTLEVRKEMCRRGTCMRSWDSRSLAYGKIFMKDLWRMRSS